MDNLSILIIVLAFGVLLAVLGIAEKIRNDRNIKSIPIRVNVNGIRGKSTATRLITSILNEAGYHTIGKTTGTAARMIYWDQEEERAIKRKPRGVSLTEQIGVINEAAKRGAQALVCECMAVDPVYQKVYQHDMLHGTLLCIVNVLEDHLDQMGPTLEQLSWAFGDTIPYNGYAVLPDCEFTDYFIKICEERNTKYAVVDESEISDEFLHSFDYRLFPQNCAIALAAARLLGIPDDVAYRGMLKAHPDPGALRIHEIRNGTTFVNGFAANEPSSSLDIWEVVKNDGYDTSNPIIVMNCRPDRVDRTRQFIKDFFPLIPNMTLLVIGERTEEVEKAYQAGKYPNCVEYKRIEGKDMKPIREWLDEKMPGRLVYGVGNIHGIGEEFLNYMLGEENPLGHTDNGTESEEEEKADHAEHAGASAFTENK